MHISKLWFIDIRIDHVLTSADIVADSSMKEESDCDRGYHSCAIGQWYTSDSTSNVYVAHSKALSPLSLCFHPKIKSIEFSSKIPLIIDKYRYLLIIKGILDINLNLGKSWEAKILFFEIRFWAFLGSFEKKNFFRFVRPYVPVIKLGTKQMASGGKPGKSHFILLRNSPEKSAKCLCVPIPQPSATFSLFWDFPCGFS